MRVSCSCQRESFRRLSGATGLTSSKVQAVPRRSTMPRRDGGELATGLCLLRSIGPLPVLVQDHRGGLARRRGPRSQSAGACEVFRRCDV